jgi:hypothetical protein
MENSIQSGGIGHNILNEIKHKKQEKIKDIPIGGIANLTDLDKVTVGSFLTNKDVLEINNNKGFLELSKNSIMSIDEGLSKLRNLNNAFNSINAGQSDRVNILNRASEILKEVQDSTNNASFNNKSIALASSHNVGSHQIILGSNNKESKSEIPNINKIDKAIALLNKDKNDIQEKINNLDEFIKIKESLPTDKGENKLTKQEIDLIQENLKNKNELLSFSHKATNEKIANLFF